MKNNKTTNDKIAVITQPEMTIKGLQAANV